MIRMPESFFTGGVWSAAAEAWSFFTAEEATEAFPLAAASNLLAAGGTFPFPAVTKFSSHTSKILKSRAKSGFRLSNALRFLIIRSYFEASSFSIFSTPRIQYKEKITHPHPRFPQNQAAGTFSTAAPFEKASGNSSKKGIKTLYQARFYRNRVGFHNIHAPKRWSSKEPRRRSE